MKFRPPIVVVLLQLIVVMAVLANPSHRLLDAPLAIHGKVSTPPWHSEASKLYESARAKLLNYLEKEQKNAIKTINAEDLGKTHLMVTLINRGGVWMENWGEPAGADFKMRAGIMHGHLGRIIGASKNTPAGQKFIENVRVIVAKTSPARAKALTNIEKLCNEKKWEQAEAALFKVYDGLEPGVIFLTDEEKKPIYQPFMNVGVAINMAMAELRTTRSGDELKIAIQELAPNYSGILQEVNSAVDSVAATGTAMWRGGSVTGPQLVEKIGQTWREMQVQAQQLRGKRWAFQYRSTAGMNMSAFMNQDAPDPIATEFSTFSQQVMKALVRLAEADATRAAPDVARTLYVEYLRAMAPLVRQTNDRGWATQLQAGLAKFQAKDTALDRDVKSYGGATSELLRWRARSAAATARARGTEFAAIDQKFYEGTVSGKVNDSDYVGLFSASPTQRTQPQLLTASPEIMPIAVQRLVGQKVTVQDVIRIAPDSKASIARYAGRTYANVPAPLPIASEVESLKADLMISEQSPPLTLAAMQAVVTAERGDMIAVGGEITGSHLEAVVTRFASLPNSAAVLSPLGQIPPERFDGPPLHNMLMRFEIAPQWVCHDYFFMTLTPPANQTASQ
jgi:hypothetical protein